METDVTYEGCTSLRKAGEACKILLRDGAKEVELRDSSGVAVVFTTTQQVDCYVRSEFVKELAEHIKAEILLFPIEELKEPYRAAADRLQDDALDLID